MMTNADIIYQCVKFAATTAASKGAKILVDEVVKQFTPDDLDNKKRICVEVAKWSGAAAFGTVCAQTIESKLDKGKKGFDTVKKFVDSISTTKKDAEPVIEDVDKTEPVEIEEEEEIPVVDLD